MAFTKITPKAATPETPDMLFRELPRRKIPDVLPHQQEMMQRYANNAADMKDVALQLPTGSGKTLVGLLIAEWRRRKYGEKIVYLCPTKQLVYQVVNQAEQKYGLSVVGFTGTRRNYSAPDLAKYNQRNCIAVTTYSSLFNVNPYFNDADIIIIDDAHAAENYVAKQWSINIERFNPDHKAIHAALSMVFKPHIDSSSYTRLTGDVESVSDLAWVDKIPSPTLFQIHDEIQNVLDAYTSNTDLKYPWGMLREHLCACHIYLSPTEILIRPLIPPTWAHSAFHNAKQRIYMSATLGEGGDLERLLGRKKIHRLPVPSGWDSQGVGRRFFIFPSLSLDAEDSIKLRRSLLLKSSRSLVLVPNNLMKDEITDDVLTHVSSLTIYDANDIEESKEKFVNSTDSVAIVANRYDGIDFPGDECRLLLIEGLPRTVNTQERFLMGRMGANILFNERIQTRVLQAIGRCTRSLEDYSAVVVTGDDLPDYLADPSRRKYFHPELQAELAFGVEQSIDKTNADFEENFDTFIDNGEDWEAANQMIVATRNSSSRDSFPSIQHLETAVKFEVEYQIALWQQDYSEALSKAESVIGVLASADGELRGYRALWEYLAGSAAVMAASYVNDALMAKSREHFQRAKKATALLPWLVQLAKLTQDDTSTEASNIESALLMLQIENIEAILKDLGTTHDRRYLDRERLILEGLNDPDKFENSHKLLGEHLGYKAGKVESTGSPDPWWQSGHICLVFEDHVNAKPSSSLDTTKARQAASHPKWMKDNVESCAAENVHIYPVLISPVSTVHPGTLPHLDSVYLWKQDDFISWAYNSMTVLRELRKTFVDVGDLVWRAQAADTLKQSGIDVISLITWLKTQVAKDILKER